MSGTGQPLRFAVVGCGWIAATFRWVARLLRSVKVTCCVDVDEERARSCAKKANAPHAHAGLERALEESGEAFEAVYVSTPHHLHYPQVKAALLAGKHVLCEKIFTTRLDHALELVELAKKRDLKLGVNYNNRFDWQAYDLARGVQAGHLGDPYYARVSVPWKRDQSYFEKGPWRGSREQAGAGTLATHASHFLDLALWALPSDPVSVVGMVATRKFGSLGIDVEDVGAGVVELADGTLLEVFGTMISEPRRQTTIEVVGSKGSALWRGPWPSHLKWCGVKRFRARRFTKVPTHFARAVDGFARWVRRDEPYLNPASESLRVLAVLFGLVESAETGKAVDLKGTEFPPRA
ncbi:MAG: hypothetical protein Kow0069_12660 [Promethearchaeota archaeon]